MTSWAETVPALIGPVLQAGSEACCLQGRPPPSSPCPAPSQRLPSAVLAPALPPRAPETHRGSSSVPTAPGAQRPRSPAGPGELQLRSAGGSCTGWMDPEQSSGSGAIADRAGHSTKAATSRCHRKLSQLQKLPLAYMQGNSARRAQNHICPAQQQQSRTRDEELGQPQAAAAACSS